MKKLYAAYGSNLNFKQMMCRCPDAVVYGRAALAGYELVFRGTGGSGVATIEPREGGCVPIQLWSISARDERNLNWYEGFPSFYGKETMEFETEHGLVPAMVYVMTPGHEPALPHESYYQAILDGYDDCGFDPAVLEDAVEHTMDLIVSEQELSGWEGGPGLG